jgi:hypothetical protein
MSFCFIFISSHSLAYNQGFYLATHFVDLSTPYLLFVFALAMTGYFIFRDSNDQRHKFRKATKPENHIIWGQKAKYALSRSLYL